MKDDFKHTTNKQASNITKDTNVEVLKYQLASNKRDARKNLIIAVLLVGIFAFSAGFIVNDVSRGEVNALQHANATLREENASLKAQNTPENQ